MSPCVSQSEEKESEDEVSSFKPKNVEKTRERNREHAKKTRLRKKAFLEGMKLRLLELQNEVSSLYLNLILIFF